MEQRFDKICMNGLSNNSISFPFFLSLSKDSEVCFGNFVDNI